MVSIYEIQKEMEKYLAWDFEENQEEAIKKFEELEVKFEEKLENIAKYITNLNAEAESLKPEIERLVEKQQSYKKKAENLKKFVDIILFNKYEYEIRNWVIKKIPAWNFDYAYRKSEAVIITDEEAISKDYKKIVETTKIDKTAIKKAIKEWKDVDGAEIKNNFNLNIK